MRECTACRQHLDESMFGQHNRRGKESLRRVCKPCDVVQSRQRKARRKRAGNVCPSCRRTKDITEPPGKCSGCIISGNLTRLTASLPSRVGRPGCIVYGSVCKVPDEANERWVEMPAVNCQRCGLDQHLPVCLDCSSPVGQGDKQKSVRPLKPCVDCGEWTANTRCPSCAT